MSDGHRRRFGPGAITLVEDTRGKGHKDHVVSDDQLLLILISIPDEVSIESLAS